MLPLADGTAGTARRPGDGRGPGNDPFNLPSNVQLFGSITPNLRRAAIVNGDIITGTDVDQRLALVLAANGGKISEERTSCARRCCAT
jgi:peptidyl-prolyl cis-trans isomerase SurA